MIKFLKFIPAQLTFFLIVGIFTGNYFSIEPMQLVAVIGTLIIIFSASYFYANKQFQTPLLFTVLAILLFFFTGLVTITFIIQLNRQKVYSKTLQFSTTKPVEYLISFLSVLKSTK